MNPMKYFELMERMDQLIRLESTGDASEFSERLGISRRQLYYYVDEMKDLGLPVCYNRNSKTFFYAKSCRLKIDISVRELNDPDRENLSGGMFFKNSCFVHSLCTTGF